MNGISKDQLH